MNDSAYPTAVPGDTISAGKALGQLSREHTADEFDLWLEAGRIEKHYWLDLWRYRELFLILAWRDISIRYKQTLVGVAWSLIQPLLTMLIMTVVFGKLAGLHSDGSVPYPIMVFAGMLPWQFFSTALANSGQSLVANVNLVSKIYFPRLIIPAGATVVSLADFLISFVILGVMMVFFHFTPSWRILTVPGFILLAFIASLGPGLIVTALNVKYRDFRFVLPFIIQFGLYLCPVGFSSAVVREKLGDGLFLLYSLNPMVGIIDGFRWAILGNASSLYLPGFLISIILSVTVLGFGIYYFRKLERSFADII
jgi:lipopolysaccharide transport system permease protein